ncbi:MAG: nucleotide exchange factor GrpE [Actinomycetota bacterium]|nr:nucleotide exchange factor GrpE [Actinomycetota bacterium]
MTSNPVAGEPGGPGDSPPAGAPANDEQSRAERNAEQAAAAAVEEQSGPEHDEAQEAEARVEEDLDELGHTRRERDQYLELAKRTRADFDNYRKRVSAQAGEALQRGKSDLARELIPVLDNLERALEAAGIDARGQDEPTSEQQASGEKEGLAKGVALVQAELRSTLERAGVQPYDPEGEPFDPAWHEALSTRAEEGTPPGKVVETIDRGYRLDGRLLRPARVVVSE